MKYVDLCGVRVSRLGLGSPRPFRHGVNDQAAEALIKRARELGINYFDTAPAYGSEHNLRVLKQERDKVVIATKSPHRLAIRQGWQTVNDRIVKQIDNSLCELNTDYIDFYYLHAITLNVYRKLNDSIWDTLNEQQAKGRIKFIGISEDVPHDPDHEMIQVATDSPHIDTLMIADPGYFGLIRLMVDKPKVGFLVGDKVKWTMEKYDVTLTGTSSLEHLEVWANEATKDSVSGED